MLYYWKRNIKERHKTARNKLINSYISGLKKIIIRVEIDYQIGFEKDYSKLLQRWWKKLSVIDD